MGRSKRHRALGRSSWCLSLGTAVAVAGVVGGPGLAEAQVSPRNAGTPTVVHRDPAADAIGVGRTRMRKGDYAGALEAFDAALRTTQDPTVRRDRGLCHEQLGHPFPAIDDLRAYLTALPDAPDADDIRSRLNQLETANGLGGTGTGSATTGTGAAPGGPTKSSSAQEDPFAVDPNDPKGKVLNGEPVAGSGGVRAGNYDAEVAVNEEWDQAEASPLRRGSGLVFGAYGRYYAASTAGITGYGAGVTIRGSLGSVSTIYGEIGYASYRSGSDNATGERQGGLGLGLGYEARIRFDQFGSNALILAGILSYERVTDSNQSGHPSINYFDPRFKLGYRHVFGPGLGLELAGEVAEPLLFASGQSGNFTTFGGTIAILVGF